MKRTGRYILEAIGFGLVVAAETYAYTYFVGAISKDTIVGYLTIVNASANILLLVILIEVTAWYAKETQDIANATKTQAEATATLAKEAEQQLRQSVRPIIRFRNDSFPALHGQNLVVHNIGLGPALNLKCWIEITQPGGSIARKNNDGHQRLYHSQVLERDHTFGEGNGQLTWQMEIVPTPTDNSPCALVAVYQDVYNHYFESRADYNPIDFGNTRPLRVTRFSTTELTESQAKQLLVVAGYSE